MDEAIMKKDANAVFLKEDCTNDIDKLPLGMAYVPMQKWRKLYEPEVGLERGTMYSELDLPFIGEEVK